MNIEVCDYTFREYTLAPPKSYNRDDIKEIKAQEDRLKMKDISRLKGIHPNPPYRRGTFILSVLSEE